MTVQTLPTELKLPRRDGLRRRQFLKLVCLASGSMAMNRAVPSWALTVHHQGSAAAALLKHKARWDHALSSQGPEGVRRALRQSTTVEILRGQDWIGQGKREELIDCLVDGAMDLRPSVSRGALIQLRRLSIRSLRPVMDSLQRLKGVFVATDPRRTLLIQIIEETEAS